MGGGRPTPGGPIGGEEVIAVWWLGVSIPLVAISGGPEGDNKPKLMSQGSRRYVSEVCATEALPQSSL